tara:strand:+ start:1793 stop:2059 length:267 start_codon:yes stop_codon:yes gene_type:complete
MKVHVEIDCTPEEARAFMGLPDLSRAQAAYSEGMEKAMRGVSNPDQLQDLARTMAPMGQAGLKMFQAFMENSAASMSRPKPGETKSDD